DLDGVTAGFVAAEVVVETGYAVYLGAGEVEQSGEHRHGRLVDVAKSLLQLVQGNDQRAGLAAELFYHFGGQLQGEVPEGGRTCKLHHVLPFVTSEGTLEF